MDSQKLKNKEEALKYYKTIFSPRITDKITLDVDEHGDFLPDYYWLLNNIVSFHHMCRHICEPSKEFKFGWYFHFYFDFLKEIIEKRNKYLIINIAPGHGKSSSLISFVCLYLGFYPHTRFFILSVTESVRNDYMRDIREILNSPYYKQLFPGIEIDESLSNNKEEFYLKKFNYGGNVEGGGHILVSPISGDKTGINSDFTIFDDPVDYDRYKVEGENYMIKINSKVGGCITRDRGLIGKEAPFILCMQRIGLNDPTEFLLNKANSKWKHIKIPAKIINSSDLYFDKKNNTELKGKFFISPYRKWFVKNGEFVFPEKFNESRFQFQRDLMNNEIDFQWQYFQECTDEDSKIFYLNNIVHYTKEDIANVKFEKIIMSIDSSVGDNDYQSMQLWGFTTFENNITKRKEIKSYLLDAFLLQVKTPNFISKIIDCFIENQPNYVLVEEKSSGYEIINELEIMLYGSLLNKKDPKKNKQIVSINPKLSKEDRARSASTEINNSRVFFPSDLNKIAKLDGKQVYVIKEIEREIDCFPNSKVHDDGVDAMTQAINWARVFFNQNKQRRFNISYVD